MPPVICNNAYKFNNKVIFNINMMFSSSYDIVTKRNAVSLDENSSMLRLYFRCHMDNRHYFYDIDNTFVFIAIAEDPSKELSITLFDNLLAFSFASKGWSHIRGENIILTKLKYSVQNLGFKISSYIHGYKVKGFN